MISLPVWQRRSLDRIEQTLVAEDPGLGLRFAVFARLTRHEAMPLTEQVPHRLQQIVRPAMTPPLMVISLLALLAAGGLIRDRGPACAAGPSAAAAGMSSASHAVRCQPGPVIKLDQVRVP
jgi:hypothetical protein